MQMKNTNSKLILVLAINLIFVLGSLGLSSSSNAEDVIKIAVIGPMTGPVADAGRAYKNASIMVVDEINAKGGVLGKQIKLFFGDTESKPSAGVNVVERLIAKDKVDIITGAIHSDVGLATMEVTARHKMPYILTGPATETITARIRKNPEKYKHIYKLDPSTKLTAFQHVAFIEAMQKKGVFKPKTKRIAIVGESTDYGRSMCEALKNRAKKMGIEPVVVEYVDMKQADYMSILTKIKKAKPDYLFAVQAALAGGVSLAKQFREIDIPVICFMHYYAAGKEEYLDLAGPASKGIVSVFVGKGMLSDYPAEYKKRWGIAPELVSTLQYDAMHMTINALKKAQSTDPDKFAEAFGKTDYNGICGRWVFNKDNHEVITGPNNFPYIFHQIWEGQRNIIWPFNIKGVTEYRTPPWL